MNCKDLTNLKFKSKEIHQKTGKIYHQLISESSNIDKGNFDTIGDNDVVRLFQLYDLHFFDNYFQENHPRKIRVRWSSKLTSAGGKTACNKRTGAITISLSSTLIFWTFGEIRREVVVNGLRCKDRLAATMRIMEHEIIHLAEYLLFGDSSCAGDRFKGMAFNIFGHTGVTHDLVTQWERAHRKFNLKVGDNVSFEIEGQSYAGEISRITKRATVMIRDPAGVFKDIQGNKYNKCYVPISMLKKVEH